MRLQRMNTYCAVFPQERPMSGASVHVWAETGTYLGEGVGGSRSKSGGVITVAGRTYDSNVVLHWLPKDA